jgi:hypothetical protein
LPPDHVSRQVVVHCNILSEFLGRLYLEHCLKIAVSSDPPIFPKPRLLAGRSWFRGSRVEESPLSCRDKQEHGQVDEPNRCNMDLVKPSWTDNELHGQQNEYRKDVEWWLIGENGISLHTFKRLHCSAELDLGRGIGHNRAKGVAKHRDEDCQEQRIAQECKCNHQDGAEKPVKVVL